MKVETKCVCCGRDIEMEVDEVGFSNPAINTKVWLTNINCNRCSVYRSKRSKCVSRIIYACEFLELCRRKGESKSDDIVAAKLQALTREFCQLTCDFQYLELVWDVEFVKMLTEKPSKAMQIVNMYARGIKNMSQKIHEVQA